METAIVVNLHVDSQESIGARFGWSTCIASMWFCVFNALYFVNVVCYLRALWNLVGGFF